VAEGMKRPIKAEERREAEGPRIGGDIGIGGERGRVFCFESIWLF
jgi:hypothetical protein